MAALVIAANPKLTAAQVIDVLQRSADDLGAPGWDPEYGWGRVNAAKAVALAQNYEPLPPPPAPAPEPKAKHWWEKLGKWTPWVLLAVVVGGLCH